MFIRFFSDVVAISKALNVFKTFVILSSLATNRKTESDKTTSHVRLVSIPHMRGGLIRGFRIFHFSLTSGILKKSKGQAF